MNEGLGKTEGKTQPAAVFSPTQSGSLRMSLILSVGLTVRGGTDECGGRKISYGPMRPSQISTNWKIIGSPKLELG